MKRYLDHEVSQIIKKKMVLVSGPRQVGKTTFSKSLSTSFEYLNYDNPTHRKRLNQQNWDRDQEVIIFDEIHKMKNWKLWLKGVYDTEENKKIIVTGSARLDTYRQVGDSMAGRYFMYHLLPLDLKELKQNNYGTTEGNLKNLLQLSGFPEPFLSSSSAYYKKWSRTHLDVILKEDLVSQDTFKKVADISFLVELVRERVGSVFSYNSLREDLNTDDKTIKRWMLALENLYLLFRITPYSTKLKSSIKKAPKYYFFDYVRVVDEAARLENLVALSLLKEVYFRNEVLGEEYSLHYLRNKNKQEIDFLICKNAKPEIMIEVKSSSEDPSRNFLTFESALRKQNKNLRKVQLVKEMKKEFSTKDGIIVTNLGKWLENMKC